MCQLVPNVGAFISYSNPAPSRGIALIDPFREQWYVVYTNYLLDMGALQVALWNFRHHRPNRPKAGWSFKERLCPIFKSNLCKGTYH